MREVVFAKHAEVGSDDMDDDDATPTIEVWVRLGVDKDSRVLTMRIPDDDPHRLFTSHRLLEERWAVDGNVAKCIIDANGSRSIIDALLERQIEVRDWLCEAGYVVRFCLGD